MKHLLITLFALTTLLAGEEPYEDLLAKNGFVILDETYKQGFEPYIDSREPVFITTDSLLMAFHRIYENIVMEQELDTLDCDREMSFAVFHNLPEKPASDAPEVAKGWKIARLYAGTAHRILFGIPPQGLNEEEVQQIEVESVRVEESQGASLPPWLASTHYSEAFAISYHFYKPIGPWASNPILQNYYRFRKWLQETPFSFHDPAHRVAFTLLKDSLVQSKFPLRPKNRVPLPLTPSILEWARPDLVNSNSTKSNVNSFLAPWREKKKEDLLYFLPSDETTDRELLDRLIRSRETDVFGLCLAASFGNSFARESLAEDLQPLAAALSQKTPLQSALSALSKNEDKRLPSQFQSQAWARKQANTICGSWTEWKYAQSLSQKEQLFVLSSMQGPDPGFLEPYPDFYRHFASCAESLAKKMPDPNQQAASQKVLLLIDCAEKLGSKKEGAFFALRWSYRSQVQELEEIGQQLFPPTEPLAHVDPTIDYKEPWMLDETSCFDLASKLKEVCSSWIQRDQTATDLINSFQLSSSSLDSRTRLLELSSLALRMKDMAERQLNNERWQEEDLKLLESYGNKLAWLMYYEGNTYIVRDDAPRIVRFASESEPLQNVLSHHAAIARPRKIIVRYPKPDGGHLDCVGSVYAFRQHSAAQTPTNEEWAETCRTSPWPDWMKPVVLERK